MRQIAVRQRQPVSRNFTIEANAAARKQGALLRSSGIISLDPPLALSGHSIPFPHRTPLCCPSSRTEIQPTEDRDPLLAVTRYQRERESCVWRVAFRELQSGYGPHCENHFLIPVSQAANLVLQLVVVICARVRLSHYVIPSVGSFRAGFYTCLPDHSC